MRMNEKLIAGKYKLNLEYPATPSSLSCENCKRKIEPPFVELTRVQGKPVYTSMHKSCTECGNPVANYLEQTFYDYNQKRSDYESAISRLREAFKNDALEDLGLLNHPKADKIFAMAWDRGHSSFHEVYGELKSLAEIFQD